MNPLNMDEVREYVNDNIGNFHSNRLAILKNLKLQTLLKKNPYLFRAKNIIRASELIEGTLSAFLSSSEEKLFGDFLEDLAIFIASKTIDGRKSSSPGMDLEFTKDDMYYVVSVKSGSNWGNSSQHKKLAQDFHNAETRLKQSKRIKSIQTTLGICYGKTKTAYDKDGYLKVVGQNFWTLISGNKQLYAKIIEPIGYKAKEHNEEFLTNQAAVINTLTKVFIEKYCDASGIIDWNKVIRDNSGNYDLDKFFGAKS